MPVDDTPFLTVHSLFIVVIQTCNLIGRFLILPTNAEMLGISSKAISPNENTRIGMLPFIAVCDEPTNLLEQGKILIVSIKREVSLRWNSDPFSCFYTPIRHSKNLSICQKHISQLFESSSMFVEILDQFNFFGWHDGVARI